jgi:hypothetical protein
MCADIFRVSLGFDVTNICASIFTEVLLRRCDVISFNSFDYVLGSTSEEIEFSEQFSFATHDSRELKHLSFIQFQDFLHSRKRD